MTSSSLPSFSEDYFSFHYLHHPTFQQAISSLRLQCLMCALPPLLLFSSEAPGQGFQLQASLDFLYGTSMRRFVFEPLFELLSESVHDIHSVCLCKRPALPLMTWHKAALYAAYFSHHLYWSEFAVMFGLKVPSFYLIEVEKASVHVDR